MNGRSLVKTPTTATTTTTTHFNAKQQQRITRYRNSFQYLTENKNNNRK